MERYNEIMAFLRGRNIKARSDRTFIDEITNMMWIELHDTGETATLLVYDRVVHRLKRFYSSKGITRRDITTNDTYEARDAHLKTHPLCSEDDLINAIDMGDKHMKAKRVGQQIKQQSGDEIISRIL